MSFRNGENGAGGRQMVMLAALTCEAFLRQKRRLILSPVGVYRRPSFTGDGQMISACHRRRRYQQNDCA